MVAALALGASITPALAGPEEDKPSSAWGKGGEKARMPAVKVGKTKAPPAVGEAKPSKALAEWRAGQKKHAEGSEKVRRKLALAPAPGEVIPEGQGDVSWHQISDVRVTDSLVARVNYSTGNLMLAATDLDVAGVGRSVQLARTYNSLDAPWGKVSQRWWQGYERYLRILPDENKVVLYDATGGSVTFTKASDGSFTTPKGYRLDLEQKADRTYVVTDRASGAKDTYSEYGTLEKVSDRNGGHVLVDQHDEGAEHKGFKLTDERSGRFVDLVKTDAAQWQAKDNTGRTTVMDLDGSGNLAKTTDPEGKTTGYGYDADGRVTKLTTPEGRVTVFTYDAQNRVTSMKRATSFDGSGETGPTYTYDYTSGATKVTDPAGNTTTYAHTADGEITKVTDALGRNRERTYDANRNVETASDAMGVGGDPANVTTYGWDARSNPTTAKLPTGATSSLTGYRTIAGADVPGKMKDADGGEVSYAYDDAGNTTKETVAGEQGGTRTFAYNPKSPTCGGFEGQRCEAKDANAKATKFHYDAKGNLDKVTPPSPVGGTTYTYDAAGRPATATDGRGVKTTYTYDQRDRITQVRGPDNWAEYSYDGDGNVTQRSDATGVTKYAFDPLNRETIRTLQDGSQTVLVYTAEGNVESYTDPRGTVKYTYSKTHKLLTLTDPHGKKTEYTYNANDARTRTSFPGGTVETIDRDKSNRPQHIKATSTAEGTLTDLSYSYAYTAGGKQVDGTKIRTRTDAAQGLKRSYDYDSAGRLTFTKETKGSETKDSWLYCYDKAGNLTSQGTKAGCPGGTTYDYNDASQITGKNGSSEGWSYDKAGNETAANPTAGSARTNGVWNDFSQQTSITQGGKEFKATYASTDQSERTKFGDTLLHHGPVGLSAQTTGGVDMTFTREPSGNLNSFRTEQEGLSESTFYYLTDAIGTTEAVVNEKGEKVNSYYYSPRGVTVPTEKVPQPYRFAGSYQDPTQLYHNAARYYDTRTGRFTQPDPSGLEVNPYLYAAGDPTNLTDPSGLLFGIDVDLPDWLKDSANTSIDFAIGGAITGCVMALETGCVGGAAAGGFSGALGGLGVGLYRSVN